MKAIVLSIEKPVNIGLFLKFSSLTEARTDFDSINCHLIVFYGNNTGNRTYNAYMCVALSFL